MLGEKYKCTKCHGSLIILTVIFLSAFQQLLNNCFDDIEKFVSRLQQAAEAYKELERRRYERGHRNKRKSAGGELSIITGEIKKYLPVLSTELVLPTCNRLSTKD